MANSIREFANQIKAYIGGFLESEAAADTAIILVILLVGFGSFGLGRLSIISGDSGGLVTYSQVATTSNPAPIPPGGELVASRNGSKYYYPWCGGAKSISHKNLIWFKSEAAALKAGYTPAKNCKGLSP